MAQQLNLILVELKRFGIVHGDLKPGNILVEITAEGGVQLQVIDFSIAARENSFPLKFSRDRGGSDEFASSEQLNNAPARFADDAHAVAAIMGFLQ